MSKQNDLILVPSLRADISFENERFTTPNVTYRAANGGYLVEGVSDDGKRRLSLWSPTKFDVTKTNQLVPHLPKEGEARLVYERPTSSIGQFNFYSDRGQLTFITEIGALHGRYQSFSNASPGNYPATEINGTFRVGNLP